MSLIMKWRLNAFLNKIRKVDGKLSLSANLSCVGGKVKATIVGVGLETIDAGDIGIDVPIKDFRLSFDIPYDEIANIVASLSPASHGQGEED